MNYYFLFVVYFTFSFSFLSAQTIYKTHIVTIETYKNKLFQGELISITIDSISIITLEGKRMALSRKNIRSVRDGLISPYFTETTNSSVPYYVQTALPNGQGNHYYKNYYLFGNEFNFGISDQINLSLGFETGSLIFDSAFPLIQVGAKYCASAGEYLHIGLSAKYYYQSDVNLLMLDTPMTFGSKRTNITISPNISLVDGPNLFGIFTNFSLGLSDKSRFVVDYAYIDEVNSAAIIYEYMFKSGFSLSLGALIADEEAIPNLSFSIPFGRWKNK